MAGLSLNTDQPFQFDKTLQKQTNDRLHGLDLARCMALFGMVIVNFEVVMVPLASQHETASLAHLLQGRAAATFVVLAGLGLGLSAARVCWQTTARVTLKRSGFLFALGMLNCVIFEADIIHYYAVYFLAALFFVRAPNWLLCTAIALFALVHVLLLIWLDYDRGWNWDSLEYVDLWTVRGFIRNLLFNGWHPVIPWFVFVLYGLLVSRLNLASYRTGITLTLAGGLFLALTEWVSKSLILLVENSSLSAAEREIALLLDTAPVPPTPLYLIAGISAASLTIGVCLLIMRLSPRNRLLRVLTTTGRYTLTLYLAHIIFGMGTLQALGLIGTAEPTTALVATLVFCVIATGLSMLWGKRFRHGPVESIMHRLTRPG